MDELSTFTPKTVFLVTNMTALEASNDLKRARCQLVLFEMHGGHVPIELESMKEIKPEQVRP
jgi:hypothetical protein